MSWTRRSPAVPAVLLAALLALLSLLVAAPAASAHEERPVTLPDGTGSVPEYRKAEPDLLVCKTDRPDFERRTSAFPQELRDRNLALFERCLQTGYRHLQEAVDAVDRPGMNIAILPGLYEEEPSLGKPTGSAPRSRPRTPRSATRSSATSSRWPAATTRTSSPSSARRTSRSRAPAPRAWTSSSTPSTRS
ncbi:hypothetical protein ACU4GG_10895 [Streptomyces nojiriensis]